MTRRRGKKKKPFENEREEREKGKKEVPLFTTLLRRATPAETLYPKFANCGVRIGTEIQFFYFILSSTFYYFRRAYRVPRNWRTGFVVRHLPALAGDIPKNNDLPFTLETCFFVPRSFRNKRTMYNRR